jgi:PadR family transcriptional regulator, regulatory protein AphA
MSSRDRQQLTSTSYAILGLLATRPWSTYALAKQMRRSLHHVWPRAESNIYAEPKRLVELGLAKAKPETVGKRPRTLYTITAEGRLALARWLATDSSASRFESEALVKVLFANHGTKDELLANLHRFADEAAQAHEFWTAVASEYVDGKAAFPERVHINALLFHLFWKQAETHARWAQWAINEVESWSEVATPPGGDAAVDVFRKAVRSSNSATPVKDRPSRARG